MYNVRVDYFNYEESPCIIKHPNPSLLKNENAVICYILALDKYNKWVPNNTYCSWVLENDVGYFIITGDNIHAKGHIEFKFIKENKSNK